MIKKWLFFTLVLTAFAPLTGPWFSGKIVYYVTRKEVGNAPSGRLPPVSTSTGLGSDVSYYICGNNYKWYYALPKKLVQVYGGADSGWPPGVSPAGANMLALYTGHDNQLREFIPNGKINTIDASQGRFQGRPGTVMRPLTEAATIVGYPCQSLQLTNEAEGTNTVYYYSPRLRVDPAQFSKHADFYAYLTASKGALPLRMVSTDTKRGIVTTSEATAVQAMTLTPADFTPNAPAR